MTSVPPEGAWLTRSVVETAVVRIATTNGRSVSATTYLGSNVEHDDWCGAVQCDDA
jgi:hypothetical protein